ncbi:ARM repeat-containing protein [Auriculariales sp. MPI-PUGE-AT-0066]|nr:ARM repeat-containing protein [Auriculariales sp. MPI-PUGE-AT-0066]
MVPHDLQRSPSAMYFDFSAQGRPPPSPFYYPSPQPMVYHRGPHSPMPAPITLAPPPAVADKTGGAQFQHAQRLPPHQQAMIMQPPASPLPHMFPGAMDYSQQMQMVMQPAPYPTQPPHGVHPQHAHNVNAQAYPQHRGLRRDEGPPAMRSQLLDEFRTNKTRKWELRDIFGYVVEFSGDQHGSRFIQQKLEASTTEEKQVVFDEIVPSSALQLIQDVFGNYVIQKLFEHGSPVQKTALAKTMEGHILQLSLQMYGCRVVQKAIEYITAEQQAIIVKELESHVLKCVLDANGNHVIQKLIECVSPDRLGFVNAFRGSVYDLSTHPFGCRVLQRCFEHMAEEQTRPLLDELHKYTNNLMQDQFGNYVIQFVLEKGKPEDRMLIVSKLRGQMLHMAKHKFASNVCEKALLTADEENQRLLIDEIMTPRADGLTPLVTMMKDQFANYVLQRALQVSQGEQRTALFTQVRSHLTNMKRYSSNYTKHLVAIERIVNAA